MRVGLAAVVLALALKGCPEDVGYVEIKIVPGYVVPPLVLGAAQVDARRASTVLRERVGPARLEFERDGLRFPFCEFDVRKNRIVTIAVTVVGREPRCKVQG